jgi:hypothetical protein
MAYEEAVAKLKRRKLNAGKTERCVNNAVADLLKFGSGRERQNIHEIGPADLEEWIDQHKTWGLSSRRTNMSLFGSSWEVAIAKGWCSLNIVDRLEPVGKIGRIVKIYPNETTLNLMAAAASNDLTQQVIAPLALGLFGCMRSEEVESAKAIRAGKQPFGWSDIDLEHGQITVSVHVAKTGDQRTIRLQLTALEWLKFAKELGNPLPPENERRLESPVAIPGRRQLKVAKFSLEGLGTGVVARVARVAARRVMLVATQMHRQFRSHRLLQQPLLQLLEDPILAR